MFILCLKLCALFGITHNMSNLEFLSFCPSADMNLGVSGTTGQWWTLRAPCERCRMMIPYRKEIFIANFFAWRGNWKPCHKAWCGGCYTPLKGGRFPIRLPKD
jgi:hypothetical protein